MSKLLDMKKVKKKYPKEWLLIAGYETDESGSFLSGKIIAHSKKRDDIYKKQLKIKGPLAIEYTGSIPKDLAVMFYV